MYGNNKLSEIGKFISPKLEKLLKLSEFFILPQVAFDPVASAAVGGIYMVANSIIESRRYNKICTFIDEIKNSDVEENINPDKEQDVEIFGFAMDKVLSASKASQIRAIVKILSARTKNNISYNEAEDLINIVSELSESEAMVLQKVHAELETNAIREIDAIKYEDLRVADIPSERMDYLLNRLVGKGLLKQNMVLARSTLTMNNYEYSLTGIAKSIFCNLDYIIPPKHTYDFDGKTYKSMAKLVYAVVQSYVEKHEDLSYEGIKNAFPDKWAKPGFGVVVEDISKGRAKENLDKFQRGEDMVWRFHTSRTSPVEGTIILHDGSHIVVSNQWNFNGNFKTFLKGVKDTYKGDLDIVVN